MIRRIFDKNNYDHRYINDVVRLQQIMAKNGYEADLPDAALVWEDYSDSMAAGWICLPKNDSELWDIIQYLVEGRAQ